ncbi:hypothetical protein D3C72_517900 [compost metagenome]
MRKWGQWYIVLTLCWIVGVLMWQIDWAHKDAPAWVQAIGSVLAIFVAIGVGIGAHISQRMRDAEAHVRTRAREKALTDESVANLLHLFRDEVEIIKDRNQQSVGGILDPSLQGAVMHPIFMAEQPFSIFHAHIDRLSSIPSRELRKMLLETYGTFTAVRTCITSNNAYIDRFEMARDAHLQDPDNMRLFEQYEFARNALDFWGPKLRGEWSKAGNRASLLFDALSIEIDRIGSK